LEPGGLNMPGRELRTPTESFKPQKPVFWPPYHCSSFWAKAAPPAATSIVSRIVLSDEFRVGMMLSSEPLPKFSHFHHNVSRHFHGFATKQHFRPQKRGPDGPSDGNVRQSHRKKREAPQEVGKKWRDRLLSRVRPRYSRTALCAGSLCRARAFAGIQQAGHGCSRAEALARGHAR